MDRLKLQRAAVRVYLLQNLHSNMDRLKHMAMYEHMFNVLNLHSNMDRLKPGQGVIIAPCGRFTFQYG